MTYNSNYSLKCPYIDEIEYLRSNIDVRKAGVNAYTHYYSTGFKENRPVGFRKEEKEYMTNGFFVFSNSIENVFIQKAIISIDWFKASYKWQWIYQLNSDGYMQGMQGLHRILESIYRLVTNNKATRLCDYVFDERTVIGSSIYHEQGFLSSNEKPGVCFFGLNERDLDYGIYLSIALDNISLRIGQALNLQISRGDSFIWNPKLAISTDESTSKIHLSRVLTFLLLDPTYINQTYRNECCEYIDRCFLSISNKVGVSHNRLGKYAVQAPTTPSGTH